MKVIHLNKVHYLSIFGVTFNTEKPFIEATEDNVLKFHKYIENGFLKVINLKDSKDNKIEEVTEVPKEIEEFITEVPKEVIEVITHNPFGEEIKEPKKTRNKRAKE